MPRTVGAKDGKDVQRHYHKQDTEHWTRPGLADVIQSQLAAGPMSYEELRELAAELGYAPRTFIQVMSNLRTEEQIGQDAATGEYTGADWI